VQQVDFIQSEWYAIASALIRQHATLAREAPDSSRIKPSLPRLRFFEIEAAADVLAQPREESSGPRVVFERCRKRS